ncbi:MAG: hypothetical protein ACO1SV_03590 [Fimbriimonas sp.]
MSRSPVPFGSRYVAGGHGEGSTVVYDIAFYELVGHNAVERARAAAETLGYEARSADDGGVVLENGQGQITIRRGRFLDLEGASGGGTQAHVDDSHDAAVIQVAHPQPSWRVALRQAGERLPRW